MTQHKDMGFFCLIFGFYNGKIQALGGNQDWLALVARSCRSACIMQGQTGFSHSKWHNGSHRFELYTALKPMSRIKQKAGFFLQIH